jgi:hypothetical protein
VALGEAALETGGETTSGAATLDADAGAELCGLLEEGAVATAVDAA